MQKLYLTPKDDLQEKINALNVPAEVYLSKGIYRQKTEIRANGVTVKGDPNGGTVITFDDYARKIHEDGREFNTFRTYTVCITGENVKLENLTIENSNVCPREVGQCVALSVNSKSFYAENVTLKSTQDTLFLAPFPDDLVVRYRGFIPRNQLYMEGNSLHLFKNCKIYGSVDFIFGCAEAYFDGCDIISVADDRNVGFVAAPAHSLKQERGFNFIDCNFIGGGAEEGSVYLARPWRDFGKCVFINCRAEKHISPMLFDKWNDTERDKTARFLYYNMEYGFEPFPVDWSKETGNDEVTQIIRRSQTLFKEYMR